MLFGKVSWNLKAVLAIHLARLLIGLIVVRVLYPLVFTATPFIIEFTDRVIVVGLVYVTVHNCGGDFSKLGLSLDHLTTNILKGFAVGLILLTVSVFSERIYTTMLFVTPADHPLVVQAENAMTWQQVISPLFLAGVLAPLTEEMLYRLFTFLPMKKCWGFWWAALASSLVFALMHFNLYWFGEMIVVGMGLAFVYDSTGSLISAIVAHSVINTSKILMLFFGVSFV